MTPPTVLLVEDEHLLREMVRMSLQENGVEVVTAMNGEEAIAYLEEHTPDMVLLDLLMPKVDGFGVLQHIRDKDLSIPVVILSNLSDPQEEEKCRELGAVDFLVKSNLDESELWERIGPHILR